MRRCRKLGLVDRNARLCEIVARKVRSATQPTIALLQTGTELLLNSF
jgi:hypothetical protein